MALLKNMRDEEVILPLAEGDVVVEPLGTVEVTDADHARSLLEQPVNWQRAKKSDKAGASGEEE